MLQPTLRRFPIHTFLLPYSSLNIFQIIFYFFICAYKYTILFKRNLYSIDIIFSYSTFLALSPITIWFLQKNYAFIFYLICSIRYQTIHFSLIFLIESLLPLSPFVNVSKSFLVIVFSFINANSSNTSIIFFTLS